MRAFLHMAFTSVFVLLAVVPALADKRVALVIGNSSYQKVAKLGTPANDAAAIAAMFKSAGFDSVESKLDSTAAEMRRALRDFSDKSRDADVAVIYYTGHAMQVDGTNYIIPVDATLAKETDVLDEALALDRALSAVESAKKLGIVLLDACRLNPFAKNFRRTRERGLARVEPNPNVLVSFAAKDGEIASDGDGPNSPYTKALLNHLAKPDQDIRIAFGRVRDDVMEATKRAQQPYVYGSFGGTVMLATNAPVATAPVDPNAVAKSQRDKLAAETARIEAAKAKEEQERLAAERARATEQTLAAEKARAEQAKRAEEAKIAEAERAKAAKPAASSSKGRRVALVIGNSKYKNAPLLPNPQRDATMVADALKRTGFAEVTLLTDLGKEATIAALQAFSRTARAADWAVVYYAGHGIEIGGINYLVPIDASLETDRDVEFEAVPLNQVLNVVGGANKLRLVVLDACRINPFANRMRREVASRAVSRGFARQDPNPGTLVVYAAKAGDVASDGTGSNSPFSVAFAQNVLKPGVEISRLFRLVGDDVKDATQGAQTPYTYGELTGREEFYFIDPK